MIAGILHQGSGVGNQLHRYVFARTLALDKGYKFGMIYPENSKMYFMNLDMGVPVQNLEHEFTEKRVNDENGVDIRGFDYDVAYIKDYTLVDGEFQDEMYFEHRLDEIRDWLKVEPLELDDNLCIIGFRGGEYVGVKDLFLPQEYWDKAIAMMRAKYLDIVFQVHTDDVDTARKFFSDFPIVHDVALNWRSVRYAKHLIIANSSFYILPALLGDAKEIIAPKFWARRNIGVWATEQNKYKRLTYI